MHWAAQYVGMKYAPGGRGPGEVDCWGLVRLIYSEQFRVELPVLPGLDPQDLSGCVRAIKAAKMSDWSEVTAPFEGCVVGMGRKNIIHHVGIYILSNGVKVLHCYNSSNVVVDTAKSLAVKGFRNLLYYQHRLWPS